MARSFLDYRSFALELEGRIQVNSLAVMERFKSMDAALPSAIARHCQQQLLAHLNDNIATIEAVHAYLKDGHKIYPGDLYEKQTHNNLEDICNAVVKYTDEIPPELLNEPDVEKWIKLRRPHSRHFKATSGLKVDFLKGHPFNAGVLPAFTVLETKPGVEAESRHQIVSFMDIKLATSPFDEDRDVQVFAAYMADYAGTVFASRPFHLFVIGMVIYGTSFRVGVFDRAGIVLSEEYNLTDHLGTFARVVRGITCDMSHVELGHDPTVRLAERHTYDQSEYPNFTMEVGTRQITTHDAPLWVSPFCFGRGISVWRTREQLTLEVAWQAEELLPVMGEGKVRPQAALDIPGVTSYIDGGAVYLRGPTSGDAPLRIDTQFLRGTTVPINLILHRSLVPRVGAMLWEVKDDREWVLALRDALRGYKQLAKSGLFIGDISPSNIFLSHKVEGSDGVLKSPPDSGFIANFASFRHATALNPAAAHQIPSPESPPNYSYPQFSRTSSEKRIAMFIMTGTPQFLAKKLFAAIHGRDVVCAEHHYLEAFALVIVYVAMVRLRYQFPQDSRLAEEFESVFENFCVTGTAYRRDAWGDTLPAFGQRYIQNYGLHVLIANVITVLQSQNPPDDLSVGMKSKKRLPMEPPAWMQPTYMTFDLLEQVLNYSLAAFEESDNESST